MERLKAIGFDVESGLKFCGGDEEFYMEMLQDYLDEAEEKTPLMSDYVGNGQWHEFEIEIHAIKSMSKTIGAGDMYEKALALEMLAKEEKGDEIRAKYPDFLKDLSAVTGGVAEVVG